MPITDNDEVTESPAPRPVAPPGLVAPILLGFLGAWWASKKAKSLGVTDTKSYWISAAISTGAVMAISSGALMLACLLAPALFLFAVFQPLGSGALYKPAHEAPANGNTPDE